MAMSEKTRLEYRAMVWKLGAQECEILKGVEHAELDSERKRLLKRFPGRSIRDSVFVRVQVEKKAIIDERLAELLMIRRAKRS